MQNCINLLSICYTCISNMVLSLQVNISLEHKLSSNYLDRFSSVETVEYSLFTWYFIVFKCQHTNASGKPNWLWKRNKYKFPRSMYGFGLFLTTYRFHGGEGGLDLNNHGRIFSVFKHISH